MTSEAGSGLDQALHTCHCSPGISQPEEVRANGNEIWSWLGENSRVFISPKVSEVNRRLWCVMLYIWAMSQRGRFVWTIPTKPSQSWTEPGPAHDFCVWRTRLWCVSVVACKRKWLWREEVEREKSWQSESEREERAPVGRQAVQPLLVLGFLRSLKYASYF